MAEIKFRARFDSRKRAGRWSREFDLLPLITCGGIVLLVLLSLGFLVSGQALVTLLILCGLGGLGGLMVIRRSRG